jgi:hypothetical protein
MWRQVWGQIAGKKMSDNMIHETGLRDFYAHSDPGLFPYTCFRYTKCTKSGRFVSNQQYKVNEISNYPDHEALKVSRQTDKLTSLRGSIPIGL